jgi:hypothetical protein
VGNTCVENKLAGAEFEKIFIKQCNMQGVAVRKKPLSCTWAGAGRLQLINSELDFEIIHNGVTVQIDTKAFESDTISWSVINKKEHQIVLAKWYRDHMVNSGLVVWHTFANAVIFYNGDTLSRLEKGTSLKGSDGEYLGTMEDFAVGNLFTWRPH